MVAPSKSEGRKTRDVKLLRCSPRERTVLSDWNYCSHVLKLPDYLMHANKIMPEPRITVSRSRDRIACFVDVEKVLNEQGVKWLLNIKEEEVRYGDKVGRATRETNEGVNLSRT